MNIITIDAAQIGCTDAPLLLGYAGEDSVEAVDFDFSSWAEEYGAGTITLEIMRASDTAPYTPLLTVDGTTARWTISDVDTARRGPGVAQFIYMPEGSRKKSAVFKFYVGKSIRSDDDADPWQDLLNRLEELLGEMQQQAADTRENAEAADQSAQAADQSAQDAATSESNAEAWAVGERGGEPVSESDPTYENNAKYWAENISGQLEDYRTAADQDAIDSAQDGEINALTNLLNKKQSKITANGILKGDGNGGISAAVPGMDYLPTSALYAYRSAIKQDEIDNAQNANIAKNADDIADVKTTADTALQPAALAPYRTAADQDTIDNAQAADIAAINDKIPSTASKNNKLVAWSTFNGQLGTKQAKITANGILKGDGAGGVSAAVAGTDYLAPSALDAYRTAAAQDEIDAAQDENIADVKAAVDQKAPIIIDSASGNIASFDDGAENMPVKQLSVNVEPIQDLHGYDSPWPAGGGANKFGGEIVVGKRWQNGSYVTAVTDNYAASEAIINCSPSTEYCVILPDITETTAFYCVEFDANGNYIRQQSALSLTTNNNAKVFSTSADAYKIAASFYCESSIQPASIAKFAINYPSAITTWTPYSNICPISGRTSANVTRTGKNLFNKNAAIDRKFINASGQEIASGNYGHSTPIKVKPNTKYCMTGYAGTGYYSMLGLDANMNTLPEWYGGASKTAPFVATTPSNCAYIILNYLLAQKDSIAFYESDTVGEFIPYQGNTYTIQIGDTVYGGQLDVTGGKMVVDRAMVDLGTLTWSRGGTDTAGIYRFSSNIPTVIAESGSAIPRMLCSQYATVSPNKTFQRVNGVSNNLNIAQVMVFDDAYSNGDVAAFKAAMSGVQLCYELATPLEITLTPTQIETLLGTNNIWADAGPVDVDYRADTKLYIDNIHQPTEDDMTADAQIASGKYFIIGNTLYKSTTVIPAGDTIIPGTNCIKTNLAEALNALNA